MDFGIYVSHKTSLSNFRFQFFQTSVNFMSFPLLDIIHKGALLSRELNKTFALKSPFYAGLIITLSFYLSKAQTAPTPENDEIYNLF